MRKLNGDVLQGPDGAIYVLTDRDRGKIVKLVPKKIARG
jgi:glucose/arabinose dehydrogenase